MQERPIHKKEIAKEARLLFKQGGQTKQQVFELLVDKYKYEKDVAEVLKYIPSSQAMAKYGIWNNVLLAVIVISSITSYLYSPSPSIGIFFWNGLLFYGVITIRIKYYMWITGLSILSLILLVALMLMSPPPGSDLIKIILALLFIIPGCLLPVWLEKKLCPKPTERKEKYTNSEGEERMRIVYEFAD